MLRIALTKEPIDPANHQEDLRHPDAGAVAWFLGTTRRTTGQRVTETLFYEAHQEMAVEMLREIAERARREFPLKAVVIMHRLGEVPVGQGSILVGCSSPHRSEAFLALPWMMDQVKRDVPIWKRELYRDGDSQWVHPGATW